jgi:hypothetical protein
MTLATTLFPPANRQSALVAFLRTFWQVIKGMTVVGGSGYVVITSAQIATLDLHTVLVVGAALILSALLSGAFAASNILVNGLPASYVAAGVATIPAAIITGYVPAPVTPVVVTAPAAGVPPAVAPASTATIVEAPAVLPDPAIPAPIV